MNPFTDLLAFNGLTVVLGAVVVLHRNHLRRPKPRAVKAPAQTAEIEVRR